MSAWFSKKPPAGQPAARPAAVKISDLLEAGVVLRVDSAREKWPVLEELVGLVCRKHKLGDAAPFVAKVREREQGISTTLDTGLSLPHARIDGVERLVAGLATAPMGLSDPQQPGLPVKAIFLFFSPNRQDAFAQHLQVLRAVSGLLTASTIAELTAASNVESILSALRVRER